MNESTEHSTEIQEIINCRANEFFVNTLSRNNGTKDVRSKSCVDSETISFNSLSRSSEAFFTDISGSDTKRDNAEKISGNTGMIDCL